MTDKEKVTASVYVWDYNSYNQGYLFGRWLDLEGKSASDIEEEISEILAENSKKLSDAMGATEVCEEVMYQDFEGFPQAFYSESSIDFERLAEFLALEDFERERVEILLEWWEDIEHAIERRDNVIMYENDDEVVECYLEGLLENSHWWMVDYDKVLYSIKASGMFFELDDGTVAEIAC